MPDPNPTDPQAPVPTEPPKWSVPKTTYLVVLSVCTVVIWLFVRATFNGSSTTPTDPATTITATLDQAEAVIQKAGQSNYWIIILDGDGQYHRRQKETPITPIPLHDQQEAGK